MSLESQALAWEPMPAGEDARWEAVVARDRESDGEFVFAVRTTGV